MKQILQRLSEFELFKAIEPKALAEIAKRGVWYSLPGGWELFGEGAASDRLHFNLGGRLVVVRKGEESEQVVGYVRAGEPVGEMSLLSGEPRSASVFALRDTEVLALNRDDVEALISDYGDFAGALTRVVLKRARHPNASFRQSAPRIFALIASSPSIDIDAHAEDLAARISRYGLKPPGALLARQRRTALRLIVLKKTTTSSCSPRACRTRPDIISFYATPIVSSLWRAATPARRGPFL